MMVGALATWKRELLSSSVAGASVYRVILIMTDSIAPNGGWSCEGSKEADGS